MSKFAPFWVRSVADCLAVLAELKNIYIVYLWNYRAISPPPPPPLLLSFAIGRGWCLFRSRGHDGDKQDEWERGAIKGATFVLEIITNNCHYILCYFTVIVQNRTKEEVEEDNLGDKFRYEGGSWQYPQVHIPVYLCPYTCVNDLARVCVNSIWMGK